MEALLGSFAWIEDPTVIARQIMAGLANGMLLFLVASGLSLIFGLSRIINFGHGALFMLGAYIAYTVVGSSSNDLVDFAAMLVLSALGTFLFGVAFEVAILRLIYRSAQASQLLVTFGLVLVMGDAVRLIWGPDEHSVLPPPQLDGFRAPVRRDLSHLPPFPDRCRRRDLRRALVPALPYALGHPRPRRDG